MKKALAFTIALCIGACSGPVTINVEPCGEGGSGGYGGEGGSLDAGLASDGYVSDWICEGAQPREWFTDSFVACSYCECATQRCFAAPFVSGEVPEATGVCDSDLKCSESCNAAFFPPNWP